MATNTSNSGQSAPPTMMVDVNRELIAPLQQFDSLAQLVSKDMVNDLTPSIQTWARDTSQSVGAVQTALETFQMVAADAFLGTSDAITAAGIAASIYGENVSKAMEKAAKAALASIAEQAGVNALNALAQGLWFLAQSIFFADPDAAAAAATDFEAAAEWGAIAGVAGAAGAAISGGRGGGSGAANRQSAIGNQQSAWRRPANRRLRPCTGRGGRAESSQRQPHGDGGGRGTGRAVACHHAEHGGTAWRAAQCHDRAEDAVCGGLIKGQW